MATAKQGNLFPGMPEDEEEVIFRPWITHPKTGKRIYPRKGKVFAIRVRRRSRR